MACAEDAVGNRRGTKLQGAAMLRRHYFIANCFLFTCRKVELKSRAKRRRIHSANVRIDVDKFLQALKDNKDTNRLVEPFLAAFGSINNSDRSEEAFNVIVRVLNHNAQLSYMATYFSALGFEAPRENFNEKNRLELAKLFATNVALNFNNM